MKRQSGLFPWLIGVVLVFSGSAAAQITPGSVTGGAAPWPVYVYDTETLERGSVIVSGIGGVGILPENSKSYSIYSGLDLGLSSRLLFSFAVSGSKGESTGWQLDDTVVHAKYKIFDGESFDFALAGIVERLPFMAESGYTPVDAQFVGIAQKSMGPFAAYGQMGYSSRKQLFEGVGARYDLFGKAIISGNLSYRHEGDFFKGLPRDEISAVKGATYVTLYMPLGARAGLTGAVGRTLLPIQSGDPATSFCTFGFGVRLR
jgi:hypothetical protein